MEENIKSLFCNIKTLNNKSIGTELLNEEVLKLAFVGDTIFDLFTRDYLYRKYTNKIKMNVLHQKNTKLVCAKKQAQIIDKLVDKYLNEEEIAFFKHARNAHPHSKSKNSTIIEYRKATGLEALLGLLLYKNEKRLMELLNYITEIICEE